MLLQMNCLISRLNLDKEKKDRLDSVACVREEINTWLLSTVNRFHMTKARKALRTWHGRENGVQYTEALDVFVHSYRL